MSAPQVPRGGDWCAVLCELDDGEGDVWQMMKLSTAVEWAYEDQADALCWANAASKEEGVNRTLVRKDPWTHFWRMCDADGWWHWIPAEWYMVRVPSPEM